MKRTLVLFFSLVLVLAPALTFASDNIVICYQNETLEVPEGDLIEYIGATFGECGQESVDLEDSHPDENLPPVFSAFSPPTESYVCEQYYYDIEAEDPESDEISFVLEGPDFMTIDNSTGIIDWTPTEENVTDRPTEVFVGISDRVNFVETSFFLTVFSGSCEEEVFYTLLGRELFFRITWIIVM